MEGESKLFFKILKALQKAEILNDIILIGSWTHHFYRIKFKDSTNVPEVRTMDVDFLVPNPPKIKKDVNVQKLLEKQQFKVTRSYPTGYTKYQNPKLDVEFLIPEFGREKKPGQVSIDKLHIQANKIRMLAFLQDYTTIITDKKNNISVRVPEPEAYVLHKFIVAQRRVSPDKKEKDLKAAREISKILLDNPNQKKRLKYIFDEIPKGWQKKIINSVEKNLPELYAFLKT
ncbi:nucleotidyltransferase domain-containing protein [bacterium]|nr:hypothetical protein [bacterium]MBU3956304.1 nucleotidyltransferase domain-containing protein [bacterium]MBU4133707.1 nucleotidyltransferase domain-containing protein [bacterium]